MKTVIGAAMLAGGIVLLVFGFQAKDSAENQVKQFFQGSPTEKTTWMLAGGAASSVAGLALILVGRGKK